MRLRELTGIGSRHALVVVTVHHQQRTRGETARCVDRAKAPKLARPLVEAGWKTGSSHGANLASVLEQSSRLRRPIVEVGARAEQRGASDSRIVSRDARRNRPASIGADQPDARRLCLHDEVVDGGAQVVDPALQREVALTSAAAAKRERHRHPTELARHAIGQLRKRATALASIERANRKAVAQNQAGSGTGLPRRARQVPGQTETTGVEAAVQVSDVSRRVTNSPDDPHEDH